MADNLAKVGEEWNFDVTIGNVEILREQRRATNDARRYRIATAVLSGIGAGIVGLGAYGIISSDFRVVAGFWMAAGPIFGAIIGYYFGKEDTDS